MAVSIASLCLLLVVAMAAAELRPNYDFDAYKFYDIRGGLVLSCNTPQQNKNFTLEWFKEGTPIDKVESLQNRYSLKPAENTFVIEKTNEGDAGNYSCRGDGATANIVVVAKPIARVPAHMNVVEGEKLRIQCAALGNPKPVVEWTIGNETYTESRDRVTLSDDNGIKNSIMVLSDIVLSDRGEYTCKAKNVANDYMNTTDDSTFVRVKDNLAALWPFLGICAEVFVLCAIILIYEKRRNKPELDESDTDQSPDQKNTPDHGKDRDIRHRK